MTAETAAAPQGAILTHEREYLDAVKRKDAGTIAKLTARECLVVGPQGMQLLNPDAIGEMVNRNDVTREYTVDDGSVQFVSLTPEVAVVGYKLCTAMPGGGTSESYDTDVWVKRDGAWTCATHCETPVAAA